MHIRLRFHKPTASLFYTLSWDTKGFYTVLCPHNPRFLHKLQRQKHSVKWKFKKNSFQLYPPCYSSHYGWPRRLLSGLEERKWTLHVNDIDKILTNLNKRRRRIDMSKSKVPGRVTRDVWERSFWWRGTKTAKSPTSNSSSHSKDTQQGVSDPFPDDQEGGWDLSILYASVGGVSQPVGTCLTLSSHPQGKKSPREDITSSIHRTWERKGRWRDLK